MSKSLSHWVCLMGNQLGRMTEEFTKLVNDWLLQWVDVWLGGWLGG